MHVSDYSVDVVTLTVVLVFNLLSRLLLGFRCMSSVIEVTQDSVGGHQELTEVGVAPARGRGCSRGNFQRLGDGRRAVAHIVAIQSETKVFLSDGDDRRRNTLVILGD
ncbi:hypothetical protein V6N13_046986 [Hibiscus sabdariffa]